MKDAAFFFATVLVILVNSLWYWAKFIVRSHGYPMSFFWGHLRDLKYLHEIAQNEPNLAEKRGYNILLVAIVTGFVLFVITGTFALLVA